MATTAKLGQQLLTEGQAGAEIDFNDFAWLVDVLLVSGVEDFGLNTPPAGVDGNAYIVGSSPTGVWAGQANALAYYQSEWKFLSLPANMEGLRIWVKDDNDFRIYDGSSWQGGTTVANLNQTISGPSVTEVQAITDKVDELLAELRTLGLIN